MSKGNMQLHIRMFLLMAALFSILYGVLAGAGHFLHITSDWFYIFITLAVVGLEYLIGPMLVGAAMRVKWVSEQEEPDLHRMVAELAQAAHVPKPRVGISQIYIPNAFAYGRTQKDGRICVTQSLLRLLSPEELRAVLGHEMSHLRNRDMAVITILSVIPMILFNIARFTVPSNDGDNDNDSGESALFGILFFIALFILYFISELIVLYGSRIREYYADRGSVRLGNEPRYLATALYKLSKLDTTPDIARIESAKAFLFCRPSSSKHEIRNLAQINIDSADGLQQLREERVKLGFRGTLTETFSTHPNILKRIKALSEL